MHCFIVDVGRDRLDIFPLSIGFRVTVSFLFVGNVVLSEKNHSLALPSASRSCKRELTFVHAATPVD